MVSIRRLAWFVLVQLLVAYYGNAQNSENGNWLPVHGNLHALVVYAEVLNDPNYQTADEAWQPGSMPLQPEKYLDSKPSTDPQGFLTDYFYQASFGGFNVTGSYFPYLVQIDYNAAAYSNFNAVVKAMNDLYKQHGGHIRELKKTKRDFDRWTPTTPLQPKLEKSDSLFDVVLLVWRINSKLSTVSNSGYCSPGNMREPLLWLNGVNCFSEFVSRGNDAVVIMRHELSHAFYGGNNFHTGGAGAGQRAFIPSVGGWSNLSSWDMCMVGWNAWDRNRLGWKLPNKKFTTSAYKYIGNQWTEHGFENDVVDTGTYVIRDFVKTGDAVRLRLPGPDSPRLRQYLWFELHGDTGRFDLNVPSRCGVYAYVQVGKDDKLNAYNNQMSSHGDYLFPLPASGRWDFDYSRDSANHIVIKRSLDFDNPIAGNHYLMRPMLDANNDGVLSDPLINPEILIDGNKPPVQHYVDFGNDDDAFKHTTQTHMSICTNPSTNSIITFNYPNHHKSIYDSDTSFITGLNIRITDTTLAFERVVQPCALITVAKNNFTIDRSVRWCGTLALKPANNQPVMTVDSGCVLLLDRSLTPMQDKVNRTDTLNGKLYFSPLTTLTLYGGTQLVVKKGATLKLVNGGKLYVQQGAALKVEDGATLVADDDAIVYLR